MPGRSNKRFLAALLSCVAAPLAPVLSMAQTPSAQASAGQATAPAQPENQRMHAVVVPDRRIDPGMRIKPPSMPPQSTPVIRPPTTTPDGFAVVVPK